MYRLLAVLLTADQPIVVKQIQDLLDASPRTIYGDMDKAESWLGEFGLQLIRKPHFGAKVEGQELFLRQACYNLLMAACNRFGDLLIDGSEEISLLLRERTDPYVLWPLVNQDDLDGLVRILRLTAVDYPETLISRIGFLFYLATILKRIRSGKKISFNKKNLKHLQDTKEYSFAANFVLRLREVFHLDFPEEEVAFITLYLLGAYTPTRFVVEEDYNFEPDPFVVDLVKQMLTAVDATLGMVLSADEDLIHGLVIHVKPMVYRLLNDISIKNELLKDIKSEHALEYYAAVIAGQCLEELLGKSISTAELGFIALHFGAALVRSRSRPQTDKSQVNVIVVCAGGIGTGKILQSRIEENLNHLNVLRTIDMTKVQDAQQFGADLIISTVPLGQVPLPHIVVNPLLPEIDRDRISQWVAQKYGKTGLPSAVLSLNVPIKELIQQHFQISKLDVVEDKIDRMLSQLTPYLTTKVDFRQDDQSNAELNDGKKVYRMHNLLTEKSIKVQCNAHDREEVVDIVGNMLVSTGAVEPRYVDAMKTSLTQNGPYMVIVPGVAILHARPQDGVNRVCMSLVTLSEGVRFGHKDNDPVDVAIAFGAVDQHQHLEALADLMRLLADDKSMLDLRNARNVQEIINIISEVLV
jgi:transcriptional antiterminator/mannitol/fructose-specific phosphotransferase system IIA component (Ntr-type)